MTKQELLESLSDIEWNDFEFKDASEVLPKSMLETVSALSNITVEWLSPGIK